MVKKMTKWLIYKHRFNYIHMCDPPKECTHSDCKLEFMIYSNHTEEQISNAAILALENICTVATEGKDELPTYNFGTASSSDILDDVKKVFLANLPQGERQVKLRLYKDDDFDILDDGSDVNN